MPEIVLTIKAQEYEENKEEGRKKEQKRRGKKRRLKTSIFIVMLSEFKQFTMIPGTLHLDLVY